MNGAVLASLAPGFKLFLGIVAFVAVLAIVLAIIGGKARSAHGRTSRVLVNRYVLLTLIAVIVLFPIYITLVNSLLAPDRIAARPPTLVPEQSRSGARTATRGTQGTSARTCATRSSSP